MRLTLKEEHLLFYRDLRDESGFLGDESVIEARAGLLKPGDRDLLLAALIYNQPAKVIAGLCHISPVTVRRRVWKLVARLGSAEFVDTARSLHLFNPEQEAVARLHIFQGKSLRVIARETSLPYHAIRRLLTEVAWIVEGIRSLKENYPSLKRHLCPPRKEKCTA